MTTAETLKMLDSLDHYKIIADEPELKWFYDHCVFPLKRNEAYAFCLSLRKKKLNEEDLKSPLGRVEMLDPQVVFTDKDGNSSYERFKKGIRAYECHKEAFIFGGRTLPAKGLVCYLHVNPCDELKAIKDLKKYIEIHEQELIDSAMRDIDRANEIANISNDLRAFFNPTFVPTNIELDHIMKRIKALDYRTNESGVSQSLYKMCKSLSKLKRLQFDNVGSKHWVDFDLDLNDKGAQPDTRENVLYLWKKYCYKKLGKGKFVIIRSSGGYHTLVDKSVIKWNPNLFIEEFLDQNYSVSCSGTVKDYVKELEYNTNGMIPVPGTYQYGNIVYIENKEDFN